MIMSAYPPLCRAAYTAGRLGPSWILREKPRQARADSKRARQRKPAIVELVAPVVVSSAAVLLTTLVLFTIESYVATEHLLLVYLLPTIFIAIFFGSTIAVLTSFASGLAAAYFLL